MKKFLLIFSLFFTSTVFSQVEVKTKAIKVKLERGADILYKLDFTPNTVIDIVNDTVASVTVIPQRNEISIKAIGTGRTNIRLRDKEGNSKLVFEVFSR